MLGHFKCLLGFKVSFFKEKFQLDFPVLPKLLVFPITEVGNMVGDSGMVCLDRFS